MKSFILLASILSLFVSCSSSVKEKKSSRKNQPLEINGEMFFDGTQRRLATGLTYQIIKPGNSNMPSKRNTVVVHYKGMYESGDVFDSSYARGETIEFPLMRVIEGWREGMQFIGEGGKIHLKIPPKLGYGERGAGSVRPNSTLYFVVELFEVK